MPAARVCFLFAAGMSLSAFWGCNGGVLTADPGRSGAASDEVNTAGPEAVEGAPAEAADPGAPGSPATVADPADADQAHTAGAPRPEPTPPPADCNLGPGGAPLARLTRREYTTAVRDLLGDVGDLTAFLPADTLSHGLENLSEAQSASALLADGHWEAARRAAEAVTAEPDRLLGLMDCAAPDPSPEALATAVDGCAPAFLRRFAERAFRHPLAADELATLTAVYTRGRELDGAVGGVSLYLQAVLQSPSFLFKVELGTPVEGQPDLRRLTDHEVAARLSFLFWGGLPDTTLRAAADTGELRTPEQVRAQAERLLQDDRARDGLSAFVDAWLGLGKLDGLSRDAAVHPDFTPETRRSMAEEVHRFVEHQVLDRDGRFEDLLTAESSFLDARLAAIYGVDAPAADFDPVALPAGRAGVLTMPAVMALTAKPAESSPVHRGKFVRERLMCDSLPAPPAGIAIVPPEPDPNATTRERWAQHSIDPACAGCHTLMDPIGFTFEGFDAVGRRRTEENGLPVDTTGEIQGAPGLGGPLADARALAEKLAASRRGPECFSKQFLRYGLGRMDVNDRETSDACSVEALQTALTQPGGSLRGMMVAMATTPAFLHRRVMP